MIKLLQCTQFGGISDTGGHKILMYPNRTFAPSPHSDTMARIVSCQVKP